MVAGMAAFAFGDLFLKLAVLHMPIAQLVLAQSIIGLMIYVPIALVRREKVWTRALTSKPIMIRNSGEALGAMAMTVGLATSELSIAAALMQTLPLVAVIGAALFLGERIGWRRWASVIVGFIGVLIIIRPDGGIDPGHIAILIGVVGLTARDLGTRASDAGTSSLVLGIYSFGAVLPIGIVWLWLAGGPVSTGREGLIPLLSMSVMVTLAIFLVTAALRKGDVSVIIPFRYSRLLFAMILAVLVLEETVDHWVLFGAALVIGSGLYTLIRERRKRLT